MKTLAEQDLEATLIDINRLFKIVENLRLFIIDSRSKDRSFLNLELTRYEYMLNQCYQLRDSLLKNISLPK